MGDMLKKKTQNRTVVPKDSSPLFVQSLMHIVWQCISTTIVKPYFSPHFSILQAIKTIGHQHNKAFRIIKP